jgi:hypothetical protein
MTNKQDITVLKSCRDAFLSIPVDPDRSDDPVRSGAVEGVSKGTPSFF